jgi:hypothetical protein
MPESRYALKRSGRLADVGEQVTKFRRRCSKCDQLLAGRKGHGFPALSGYGIFCGGCAILKVKR